MTAPPAAGRSSRCPECREGSEHCHEVLLSHADGTQECTGGPMCRLSPEAHALIVHCDDLIPTCGCSAGD